MDGRWMSLISVEFVCNLCMLLLVYMLGYADRLRGAVFSAIVASMCI